MTAKHYKASCNTRRANDARIADARAIMARINRAEDQLRERRGVVVDGLTRDTRTADAKALDGARKHLTGKAPRTADESNHLAALAESPRVLRRLQLLREWSHEQSNKVFP